MLNMVIAESSSIMKNKTIVGVLLNFIFLNG